MADKQKQRDVKLAVELFNSSRALTKQKTLAKQEAEAALVGELQRVQDALKKLLDEKARWQIAALIGNLALQAIEEKRR